jgi:phospholipid-binding lipoprotein MlaA
MHARALFCALALLAGGCATNGDPRDPLEPMNRAIYHFNDGFDQLLVKPAAELYTGRMIPEFVRTGLRNFFSNINDVIVAVNDLLQGKFADAGNDVGRIVINSTAGILGFMDPATDAGLLKNNEDFGQTLGVWGFGDGPYLVLPILGPSSVRDTVGWVGDIYTWPITYVKPNRTRNTLVVVRFVGIRADLLAASKVLEAAALDPYIFVRDAYLQRRRNMVFDGRPPPDEQDLEPPAKPGASTSESTPQAAGPFDDSYTLVPAGGMWNPIGLKAPEDAAADSDPDRAPEPSGSAQVVRVWLPARP